jgi:predicted translin family RNA/ssDNA-binding protein
MRNNGYTSNAQIFFFISRNFYSGCLSCHFPDSCRIGLKRKWEY